MRWGRAKRTNIIADREALRILETHTHTEETKNLTKQSDGARPDGQILWQFRLSSTLGLARGRGRDVGKVNTMTRLGQFRAADLTGLPYEVPGGVVGMGTVFPSEARRRLTIHPFLNCSCIAGFGGSSQAKGVRLLGWRDLMPIRREDRSVAPYCGRYCGRYYVPPPGVMCRNTFHLHGSIMARFHSKPIFPAEALTRNYRAIVELWRWERQKQPSTTPPSPGTWWRTTAQIGAVQWLHR